MRRTAVALYCAVVGRFDTWYRHAGVAARESPAGFNQQAESVRAGLGTLNLGLEEGWQGEPERGAVRLGGVRPQSSAVGIDDGPADRQADSQSAGLRGVEGFEHPLAMLQCDAWTRVANRDEHAERRTRFGADDHASQFSVDAGHGFDRIEAQIQHHLLQLNSICANERKSLCEPGVDRHAVLRQLASNERNHVTDGIVQVDVLLAGGKFLT